MRRFRTQCVTFVVVLLSLLFAATIVFAEDEDTFIGPVVENDLILVMLFPHTPDQMAAFYEARGFPSAALKEIKKSCFITAHIENKSDQVIWLEPSNWYFLGAKGLLQRHRRDYWGKQWDRLNMPQSKRATFGWTLLPESRDLRPGEPVGGNITLPLTQEPFSVSARFVTGKDKRKGQIHVQFDNIHCPDNQNPP